MHLAYWSIAQTKNRETKPEGMGWELFKNYLAARDKFCPDFFLYENNKSMSSAIREQITRELGVEPILINSALLSAQNRLRLYWTNIPGVEQPKDLGIVLRDILEDDLPYCKSDCAMTSDGVQTSAAEPVNVTSNNKAQCLRATYYKDGIRNMVGNTIDRKTCVAVPVHICGQSLSNPVCLNCVNPTPVEEYQSVQDDSTGRGANQFLGGLEKSDRERWLDDGKSYSRNFNLGRCPFGVDGKSATVTSQGFGLAGHAGLYVVPVGLENQVGYYAVPNNCDVIITDNSIRCQRWDKSTAPYKALMSTLRMGRARFFLLLTSQWLSQRQMAGILQFTK